MAVSLVPTRAEELADAHLALAAARRSLGDVLARLGAANASPEPGVALEAARVARITAALLDDVERHMQAAR